MTIGEEGDQGLFDRPVLSDDGFANFGVNSGCDLGNLHRVHRTCQKWEVLGGNGKGR